MRLPRIVGSTILTLSLLAALAPRAAAQAAVTAADLDRLQDAAFDASRDVSQVRSRDAALAGQLQADLDEARDETVYLKVKLRKNEPVTRRDYTDLRDRIDAVRSRARGEASARPAAQPAQAASPAPAAAAAPRPAAPSADLPVGAEFDVRLQAALNSSTAAVEDRFEGTTIADLRSGDRIVVPAGSLVRGVVSSVTKAGRLERKGTMTVVFDQITVAGRAHPIRATVTQTIESEGMKSDAGKIGVGAGVGAILGGLLGGTKGAIAGILVGGGGTIAASEGKDVSLPPGTILRVRLDTALNVR